MIILDNQARQQMTLHFQLSLQCNGSPITGFVRHTAEVKSYLLVCLIVQNNHPPINSRMPNNFHTFNMNMNVGHVRIVLGEAH